MQVYPLLSISGHAISISRFSSFNFNIRDMEIASPNNKKIDFYLCEQHVKLRMNDRIASTICHLESFHRN